MKVKLAQLENLCLEVQNSPSREFLTNLRKLFSILDKQFFYKTLFASFDSSNDELIQEAKKCAQRELQGTQMNIDDEKCCQITSYFIMRKIQQNNIPSTVEANYIKETYLKPFCRMIQHYYDSSENILHWLLKYKKRTEWYDNEKILQELNLFRKNNKKNPRIEENFFAPKINKYLFDKEIEIISEPKTCGRRVDVLGLIPNGQGYSNFLLEYKVILKTQGKKTYFKEAFYQTYLYGKEYQKNIVYLVVFIIGEGDVELNLDQLNLENDLLIPYFEFDNVRIVVIKIMLKSSNFKGKINKDDLITFFNKNKIKGNLRK